MGRIELLPYIWTENPSVDYITTFYIPTIRQKIEQTLHTKNRAFNSDFLLKDRPHNIFEPSVLDIITNKQRWIIEYLSQIKELNEWRKPIVLIVDDCFTNDLIVRQLWDILWNRFDDFVEIVSISINNYSEEDDNKVSNHLHNNSIIILWWSFSDAYSVNNLLYNGKLWSFIKRASRDSTDLWEFNTKIVWICFWQQYIANIMWIDRIYTDKITTTIKWPAEFWYIPIELDLRTPNIPYLYKQMMDWITWKWAIQNFTVPFTRTWYVDFNLLNSQTISSSSFIPLMKDSITSNDVMWWSRNGNILWIQPHLEIDIFRDEQVLRNETENIIPFLINGYWENIERILLNINNGWLSNSRIGDVFYTNILYELTRNLLSRYHYVNDNVKKSSNDNAKKLHWLRKFIYRENTQTERIIKERVNYLLELEKQKKLRMLTVFDWKINRLPNQVWETLWIKDLIWLIKSHRENKWEQYNGYIFRDFWAWNWALTETIDNIDGITAYWIWDYAYFDLYNWIKNNTKLEWIPDDIKKIFIQELIKNLVFIKDLTLKEIVSIAIDKIDFNITKISNASMFQDSTTMFNEEWVISEDTRKFILENPNVLEFLKKEVSENFYEYIEWYFEKLLVSDFNNLYIKDERYKLVDFQVAIRSTSHIDSDQLSWTLEDYVKYFARPGSIYFDNWLVRSYTSVPRVREYIELYNKHKSDWVDVFFIFDTNTNYISSAVIMKEPFFDITNIEKQLLPGFILLHPDDIEKNSFFVIERFIRELIIVVFKDYKIFYDKNAKIMEFLKYILNYIEAVYPVDIHGEVLWFINGLINEVNLENNENYTLLNDYDFLFYTYKIDWTVNDFLKWENIFIPNWFNHNFKRKN